MKYRLRCKLKLLHWIDKLVVKKRGDNLVCARFTVEFAYLASYVGTVATEVPDSMCPAAADAQTRSDWLSQQLAIYAAR